jgi:predicted DNA-binding transcriptional regulator
MEVRALLSKDQAIGVAIFLVCVVVAIFYVATLFYPGWLELLGLKVAEVDVRFWIVAVPVFIAFIAIMGIGAWIGWTMATTPPPKPIEEVTSESEEKTEKVSSE